MEKEGKRQEQGMKRENERNIECYEHRERGIEKLQKERERKIERNRGQGTKTEKVRETKREMRRNTHSCTSLSEHSHA